MAERVKLSDWQIEQIKLAWAETGNAAHAARVAGCSATAAKRYISDARKSDGLDDLRRQKRGDIVSLMAAVRLRALEELMTPARLEKASIGELATLSGIMTDKIQLLTGGATHRGEHSVTIIPSLTPEEREQARALREKMLNDGAKVTT